MNRDHQTGLPYDSLIQAYLDGQAAPQDEEQFRRLLNEPEFCVRLADYALDSACLYELAQQGVLDSSAEKYISVCPPHTVASDGWRKQRYLHGAVLAICLCLVLATTVFLPGNAASPLGTVGESSAAMVIDAGGERAAAGQMVLRSGDALKTSGHTAFATFDFEDGSQILLSGSTYVVFTEVQGQKKLQVRYGDVDADVRPQSAGKPMLFVTRTAEARVIGTRLLLSVDGQATTLGVTKGHVVMKRLSDGRSVDVRGGFHAVASPESELESRPIPPAPDTWSVDFEEGLPTKWGVGQWVSDGLPAGSQGGIRAARWKANDQVYYMIRSHKISTSGLFRIEDDTYFNFTYKLEKPNWFNLFIGVRPNELGQTVPGNYAHKEASWWQIQPGEWRTVSVPMARFHRVMRPDKRTEAALLPPKVGDAVNIVWFSTPRHDRGLTIDRIWVSRGNPAQD